MPTLPVESDDWGDLLMAAARLLIEPGDYAITQGFEDQFKAKITFQLIGALGVDRMPPTDDDVRLANAVVPAEFAKITDIDKGIRDAVVAGYILIRVLRLAIYHSEKASVENAIQLLGPELKRQSAAHKRSSLLQIWSRYKHVSPFTAGWIVLAPELLPYAPEIAFMLHPHSSKTSPQRLDDEQLAQSMAWVQEEGSKFQATASELIARYFAYVEWLRKLGEKHYAHGQKKQGKSCLDRAKTWSVPKQFKLPDLNIEFPPLTDAEQDILEKIQ